FALATAVIVNDDFAGTGNGHTFALGVGNVAQADGKADGARRFGFHRACHGSTRCRTTDVEGTHRKLRAGLADGLRGDHTDRFTAVDQVAAAQVTAVAM